MLRQLVLHADLNLLKYRVDVEELEIGRTVAEMAREVGVSMYTITPGERDAATATRQDHRLSPRSGLYCWPVRHTNPPKPKYL